MPLPLSEVTATPGRGGRIQQVVINRARAVTVADVHALLGHRHDRELSVVLAGVPHFVRQRHRYPVEPVPLLLPRVLRRGVEERVIAANRAADPDRRTRLGRQQRITERSRFHSRARQVAGQLVAGNESGGQPLDAPDARHTVRSGPADDVDDAAAGATGFSAHTGALQVHFGDIELVDLGAQIAETRVRDVGAVDQIGVVLEAAAACGSDAAAVVGDAWHQLEQPPVGALERQGAQLLCLEVEARLTRADVHS